MNRLQLESDPAGRRRLRHAAAASAAAGVIHVAAAVPHFSDDLLFGGGFLLVGWLQVLLAALLLHGRGTRKLLVAGVGLHLAALGTWLASRTVGLPLGHGGPEAFALPDLLTAGFELVAVGLLAWRLGRPDAPRVARPVAVTGLVATWLLVLGGSTAAVADLGLGGHGGDVDDDHHGVAVAAEDHADGGGTAGDHADTDAVDDRAPVGDTAPADDVTHRHDDGSVHLHAAGTTHQHDDGSLHLHDVEPITPGAEAGDGDAQPSDDADHEHAPGEEH